MQKAAEEGFRTLGYWGSAIVLDPRSGDVLTLVSLPAYDPNAFAAGIDRAAYQALITDKLRPLQNRAIQGRYSPGSTFKLVVATAALEEGLITPVVSRQLRRAARSSTGATSNATSRAGTAASTCGTRSRSRATCTSTRSATCSASIAFTSGRSTSGLHGKSGIDLPNEQDSLVPSSEWKKQRTGERWYPGETISVAIGQGQNAVTPMGLAVMMSTLANGGTRHVPRLVKAVDDGERAGRTCRRRPTRSSRCCSSARPIQAIHDGLWLAVNGAGTAVRARIEGRDVAGKTGTAQVISLQGRERARGSDKDLRDHGWFVFMVPRDNPELAGVVFAEHSEHGYLAAPIAKHVIETYYAEKEGRPLPTFDPRRAASGGIQLAQPRPRSRRTARTGRAAAGPGANL